MARRIEGYCQPHDNQEYADRGNTVFVNQVPRTDKDPRCTVVVHEGKPERVFTESEVKAYEKDLMRALSDPGAFTERHLEEKVIGQPFEETVPQWVSRARAIVRATHGLSDPA